MNQQTADTRVCPHCKNTVALRDAYCKYCGLSISGHKLNQSNGMTPLPKEPIGVRGIVTLVFACILVISIIVSILKPNTTPDNAAKNAQVQNPPFIVESVVVNPGFWSTVEGVIFNNTNRSYSTINVVVGLYDADGVLVRNEESSINGVGALERWKFSVWSSSYVKYARVRSVEWNRFLRDEPSGTYTFQY